MGLFLIISWYVIWALPTDKLHPQAPWARGGTSQYLAPQHPNNFPHAHMRDGRVVGLEMVEL